MHTTRFHIQRLRFPSPGLATFLVLSEQAADPLQPDESVSASSQRRARRPARERAEGRGRFTGIYLVTLAWRMLRLSERREHRDP
jgi:hypothetical protein